MKNLKSVDEGRVMVSDDGTVGRLMDAYNERIEKAMRSVIRSRSPQTHTRSLELLDAPPKRRDIAKMSPREIAELVGLADEYDRVMNGDDKAAAYMLREHFKFI